MTPAEANGTGQLAAALAAALGGDQGYADDVAADLIAAYRQAGGTAAETLGVQLVQRLAAESSSAKPLGSVIGALHTHLAGAGQVETLSEFLADLCNGYLGELLDQLNRDQIQLLTAGEAGELGVARDAGLLRAVFSQTGVGVGISAISGEILTVNNAFAAMLGYTVDEFMSLSVTELTHPDDTDEIWEHYAGLISGQCERLRLEKPQLHRDGHTVWVSMNASLIRDSHGEPAYTVVLFEDVTDRRALQEQLRYQAQHDSLTGLPNRSQLYQRMAEAFTGHGARVGVCYVDLDRFKAINDTLGHDIGDKLLVEVAERLRSCLPEAGHMVARMGGDEFVILAPDISGLAELSGLADQALKALRAPFHVDGHQLTVSASIGVMEGAVANTTAADLMRGADATLYWAKEAGRDGYAVFDPDRSARENTRYELSAAMRDALRAGEFVIEYQPIARLGDGRIVGAEALVRWHHSTLGRLTPDRFIDLAEDNGMILPLGEYVCEQACREAAKWPVGSDGHQPFVSINVSARQVHDPGFIAMVERCLAVSGLAPQAMQLEVTESIFMDTSGRAAATLDAASRIGAAIAIDDFGTGFSNLAYLRSLPVNVLKLAGSFIESIGVGPDGELDKRIVEILIDLAHSLGQTVTAEQVETAQQATLLHELGCDNAQGWYFARPMSAASIAAVLAG